MMFLLDTNVVSELRKAYPPRRGPAKIDRYVAAWIGSVPPTSLHISAISVLELEIGCLLLERRDPVQGQTLRRWLRDYVMPAFATRTLPVDAVVEQKCAALHVPDPMDDRDSLIAATALVHGMTVVTRNVAHFQRTSVALLNPWQP